MKSDVEQPFRRSRGGLIERSRPLEASFDGTTVHGFAGDTLASALLANGIHLVGRSFKYHRPRGIMTAGVEEPAALVELGSGATREPNTKATLIELREGLEAHSQNCWPSPSFDLMSLSAPFSSLLSAGFYYKTFMWPSRFWEQVYEPAIRRAAGLGRAPLEKDPDRYGRQHAFCDVLIVGAGPAGLTAAIAVASSGARVILCDPDFVFGGRLNSEHAIVGARSGADWAARAAARLAKMDNVTLLDRTAVFGAYDGGVYGAIETCVPGTPIRQRYWKIAARHMILATGATERLIAFGGNDRPGVMLAGAVRSYANRFGVLPGRRAIVFCNNDDGWQTAQDLDTAGVEVIALVDSRPRPDLPISPGRVQNILSSSVVTDTIGGRHVKGVKIRTHTKTLRLDADLLAISGGWNPNLALATHRGAKLVWDARRAMFTLPALPANIDVAGSAAGQTSLENCLDDGERAARTVLAALGRGPAARASPIISLHRAIEPLWQVASTRDKAFVDIQNDVTVADIELAAREGFTHPEHAKRYTTLGMGTDQGGIGGVTGHAVLAAAVGRSLRELGMTAHRPPAVPVTIGAIAGPHRGRHFRPTRLPPSHHEAARLGAVFTESGPWLRAQYFPRSGDASIEHTIDREALTVRRAVGVCDVSTLGRLEIVGDDAGAFLDRVYANTMSTLAPGKCRYGLMLREDGFAFDDGVAAKLDDRRYVISTTTANADHVLQHLEYCRQLRWPSLDVQIVPVTEQWAQFAIAGPDSRELLRQIVDPTFDLSPARFPWLAAAELTVCEGTPARLFGISFSGELAFELAVPARLGPRLFTLLLERGRPYGIAPYGLEALSVLRIEKGHVTGAELNGQTTAHDLGLGKLLSTKKDYIGRSLAFRPALMDATRPTLVGIRPVDPQQPLCAGAHLLGVEANGKSEGYVTSVARSATLGHWIGLGLLANGSKRSGEVLRVREALRGGDMLAQVCAPVFVDPEGTRVRS